MQFNPISIVLTLVGGLLLAAILGWIRRPRLTVFVPRTFSYNQLSEKGHLVEVTVFNRGFKTEENIDVTLNPSLKYELVGANSPDATVDKNRLKMARIAPADEITILLNVEGGVFKPDDIVQTVSKETKGITVAKLEEVPPTASQRIWLVGIFIVLPAVCYLSYVALQNVFSSPEKTEKEVAVEVEKTGGWTVLSIYKNKENKLYAALVSEKLSIDIGKLRAKNDLVAVPFKITNNSGAIITATAEAITSTEDKRAPRYQQRFSDVIIFPGATVERSINVIIPVNGTVDERTIFAEIFLQDAEGETMKMMRSYIAPEKL